jgi:hypothetical protein
MDRRWGIAWLGAGLVAGWLARSPDAPVPEQVIRWIRAPGEVRTEVEVQHPARASAACLHQRVAALAWLGVKPDVGLETPATEPECRAQLDLAAAVATARQLEREGRPEPFTDDVPEKYREAAVTEVVKEVVEACPELGLTLRRVDCSEYPCMAWFVGEPDSEEPWRCKPWVDAYGAGGATSSHTLIDADGQRFRTYGLGPYDPERERSPDPMEIDSSCMSNESARMTSRYQAEMDALASDLGARERTTVEQHEDELASLQRRAAAGDERAAQAFEVLKERWAEEDAADQQ